MIRILLIAIWGVLVSLSSSYAAVYWRLKHAGAESGHEEKGALEQKKTRIINVPIIADGQVQGYVVAQFLYIADAKALKTLPTPPDALILDEAFRMIYSEEKVDFRKLDKMDLTTLIAHLKEHVQKRLDSEVVKDVLLVDLNYVPKEEVRK